MKQPVPYRPPVRTLLAAAFWLVLTSASAQNRIAFVNPVGQLVTISPDGDDARILTPPTRRYGFPAWSPVADELAVIDSDPAGGGVFTIQDRVGAELRQLYGEPGAPPIYLYWAPGGEKVGFLASSAEGLGLQIAGTEAGARDVRQLATGNPLYWQWSGDGARLLVHSGVGSAGQLAFYSAAGEVGKPLAEPGLFNAPGLSFSGRYLAYAELGGGATRVVLRGNRKDTARVRREVRYEGLAAFSWSPAGEQLAIMSPPNAVQNPYGPVRLLDAETGNLTPLVESLTIAFFWSPDGEHIAYLTPFRRGSGQLAGDTEPTPAEVGTLVSTQMDAAQPELLLELRVAEVATGRTRLLTAFSPTPLFVTQFLPFFDQYALSHSVWSPESDALVLPMLGESGPQVVVVPLEGEPEVLAAGETPFWSRR